MTAKRVTIGAKPTLVQRETAEPVGGESEVLGAPAEAGPSSASPASIEDWLRNGETSADEKAPAPAEATVVPIAAAALPPRRRPRRPASERKPRRHLRDASERRDRATCRRGSASSAAPSPARRSRRSPRYWCRASCR